MAPLCSQYTTRVRSWRVNQIDGLFEHHSRPTNHTRKCWLWTLIHSNSQKKVVSYKSCCELSLLVQCTTFKLGLAAQNRTVVFWLIILILCYNNKNGENLQLLFRWIWNLKYTVPSKNWKLMKQCKTIFKVWTFWEAHKNLRNLPHT